MTGPAKLISITPNAEEIMAYCARVSSPHQEGGDLGLLRYCIKKGHWSVFTMANMNIELRTSRMISPQLLRHWSFDFQEFSQRYAEATEYIVYEARRQDTKDRQNSFDDLPDETKQWWIDTQIEVADFTFGKYKEALEREIAKECARAVLPLSTATKVYVNGSLRTWIHYLQLRCGNGTQKEHRDLADACKAIFVEQLPVCAEALGWLVPPLADSTVES